MKKESKKGIAFTLTLALFFCSIFPAAAVYAQDPLPTEPEQGNMTKAVFRDVENHWGKGAVEKAVSEGYIKGYEDGTFRPDLPVTRAEFVTMVNNALQLRNENTVKLLFEDVGESDWFYQEIQKACYAKYAKGIDDLQFMPNKSISRQEAASMLVRLLPGGGYKDEAALYAFPDQENIPDWAKSSLAVAVNKGYLTGHSDGRLSPFGIMTRAEAATVIGKMLDKETIIQENVSVVRSGETLQNAIYTGDITIEKSVGEGDASLKNISALSKVYVLGGGANTVTIEDALIIRLFAFKEGTGVRVLSSGDTKIHETLISNKNRVVDSEGNDASQGQAGYETIIYLSGITDVDTAVKIAEEIGKILDSSGKVENSRVLESVKSVVSADPNLQENEDGSINIVVKQESKRRGGGGGYNGPYVNGLPAKLTALEQCSCGLQSTSYGAFTHTVEFDPDGVTGGTTATGYAIQTEAQLQHLALHTDDDAVLMKNLDFSGITSGAVSGTPMHSLKSASESEGILYTGHPIDDFIGGNFVPIGAPVDDSGTGVYSGSFYGNEKTVNGLIVSGQTSYYVGLFSIVSGGAIRDLTISKGEIAGRDGVGGLAGGFGFGTIDNCEYTGTVTGDSNAGGLAGIMANCDIFDSSSSGIVCVTSESGGGLVGIFRGSMGRCSSSADVSGIENIGGLIGRCDDMNMGMVRKIFDCHATGNVTGDYNTGGLVGNSKYFIFEDCSASGNVAGEEHTGGLTGYGREGSFTDCSASGDVAGEEYTGGLVGNSYQVTFTDCSASGDVSGTNSVGGLTGNIRYGLITDSHSTSPVLGRNYVGGLAGNSYYSEISFSYANNPSISVSGEAGEFVGRISGSMAYGYVHNYANGEMIANSCSFNNIGHDQQDGEDYDSEEYESLSLINKAADKDGEITLEMLEQAGMERVDADNLPNVVNAIRMAAAKSERDVSWTPGRLQYIIDDIIAISARLELSNGLTVDGRIHRNGKVIGFILPKQTEDDVTITGIRMEFGGTVDDSDAAAMIAQLDFSYLDFKSAGKDRGFMELESYEGIAGQGLEILIAVLDSEYVQVFYEVESGEGTLTATVDGDDFESGDELHYTESIVFTAIPESRFEVAEFDGASTGMKMRKKIPSIIEATLERDYINNVYTMKLENLDEDLYITCIFRDNRDR